MFIGAALIRLHLPENQSLKDKRQVLQPIIKRVQNHFNISIAEVGDLNLWQSAELGITCVSGEAQHATEMLSRVVSFIEGLRVDAQVIDIETELISAF